MRGQEFWDRLKGIGQKVEKVVFDPIKFFEQYKLEDFTNLLVYYSLLVIISSLIDPLVLIIFYPTLLRSFILPFPILYLTLALMVYVLSVFGVLVMSLIYHGLVWLVGGRKWIKTFAAVVYSLTPTLLLSWVPVIGFLAFIWSLVLLVIGLAKIHKMSYWRSAVAVILLPAILLFGLIFTVGILLMRLLV